MCYQGNPACRGRAPGTKGRHAMGAVSLQSGAARNDWRGYVQNLTSNVTVRTDIPAPPRGGALGEWLSHVRETAQSVDIRTGRQTIGPEGQMSEWLAFVKAAANSVEIRTEPAMLDPEKVAASIRLVDHLA